MKVGISVPEVASIFKQIQEFDSPRSYPIGRMTRLHLGMPLKQSRLDSDKAAGYCRRFPWQGPDAFAFPAAIFARIW